MILMNYSQVCWVCLFIYLFIFLLETIAESKLHWILLFSSSFFLFFYFFFIFVTIREKNHGSITPFPIVSQPMCLVFSNSYSMGQFKWKQVLLQEISQFIPSTAKGKTLSFKRIFSTLVLVFSITITFICSPSRTVNIPRNMQFHKKKCNQCMDKLIHKGGRITIIKEALIIDHLSGKYRSSRKQSLRITIATTYYPTSFLLLQVTFSVFHSMQM